MNRFKKIIMVMGMLLFLVNVHGQESGMFESQVPTAALPSEQTYSQIQQTSGIPGLRAAPGDIDPTEKPQKVPLRTHSMGNIIFLIITLSGYTIYRTNKRRNFRV